MKKTWYFGALLILFTSLGVYQNQISEPNQEIVLKFSDAGITSDEAQSAIVVVKKQLQTIGINAVHVKELKDGQLKITYYSDANIESVKRLLSKENKIEIGCSFKDQYKNASDRPSQKKTKNYKLDVFEIHKSNGFGSGLDGKCALNLKQDYERFYNPNVNIFDNVLRDKDGNNTVKVAIKLHRNIAVAIDNTSRNIPEVRAGPTALGIA